MTETLVSTSTSKEILSRGKTGDTGTQTRGPGFTRAETVGMAVVEVVVEGTSETEETIADMIIDVD